MIYLLNAPILTAYGDWSFKGPISEQTSRFLVGDQAISSAIGHESSAILLSRILGRPVETKRISVELQPGDSALVLRLCERLPEGAVLDTEQITNIPYELGWLSFVNSHSLYRSI